MSEDWRDRLSRLNPEKPKPSLLWMVLVLIGLYFFAAPWIHGGDFFTSSAGSLVLRTMVAFLFFFCAYFSYSLHRLRLQQTEISDAVDVSNSALFGKEWKSKRDAVAILIQALSSQKEDLQKMALDNLKKLTGQDFGSDREKWESWWAENRTSFRGPVKPASSESR